MWCGCAGGFGHIFGKMRMHYVIEKLLESSRVRLDSPERRILNSKNTCIFIPLSLENRIPLSFKHWYYIMKKIVLSGVKTIEELYRVRNKYKEFINKRKIELNREDYIFMYNNPIDDTANIPDWKDL